MMISTKGRYALRVMVDLAEQTTGGYTPLKEIAERQDISQKYLESIMAVLSKAGYVDSLHGKGGGYRLNRAPNEYTVGSILTITEGTLTPVACLENKHRQCPQAAACRTLPMWTELDRRIRQYLDSVTVGDLAQNNTSGDYVI